MHTIKQFCEQLSLKDKTLQACPEENAHAVLFHKQIEILSSEMGTGCLINIHMLKYVTNFTLSAEKDFIGPP